MSLWSATVGTFATLFVGGCAATHGVVASAPAARYVPPADRYVRSVLLDFETPTDAAFVESDYSEPAADPIAAGNKVLSVHAAGLIRLGALLRGRAFPGPWDLIGLRVLSTGSAAHVTAELADADGEKASGSADASASAWTTLWIETAALRVTDRPTSAPSDEMLELALHATTPILIDDVVLAQGRTVVADSVARPSGARFHVERSGLSWRATLGDRALATLPAAPFVDDGYRVVEANAARAVFANAGGSTVCVDRLGRVIRDGAGAPPATVAGVDGAARLVRNAPGDRDNDGYDETRGCFTFRASGDRFTVHLEPAAGDAAGVVVFDVDGLRGDGVASVWVQGELIGATTRTTNADGTARTIVELPLRVERPVDVCVSVR